jgi:hypothetical protein
MALPLIVPALGWNRPLTMDSRFLDVNDHGVLRVPAWLWVALALLARYWVLLIVVAVSARRSQDAWLLIGPGNFSWVQLIMELPVLFLALAGARRVPKAGVLMRFCWRYGRELMALTVAANLGWTVHYVVQSDFLMMWPHLFLACCCLLDAAVMLSVYTGEFPRQLFREFPPRPEEPEGATP